MASSMSNSTILPMPFATVLANMALLFAPFAIMFIALTYDIWAHKDRGWWASATRTVVSTLAAFAGFMVVCFGLLLSMYYWTIPVLFFIADHRAQLILGCMAATILGIWAYIAYEDYKLTGSCTGHIWGLFHVVCTTLFITAFIYQHPQAMAWIALIWGFASFFGLIENLEGQQRLEILRQAYFRASLSPYLR